MEKLKDTTADYLMETDKDLEYIKQWTMDHKEDISPFRKVRDQIRDRTGHYLCKGLGRGRGGGGIMGWARPIFLEKRDGPKENFTMIGGGSLCVVCKESHSLQFTWKI